MLVFWGTWCGPCMRFFPAEKALVERSLISGQPSLISGPPLQVPIRRSTYQRHADPQRTRPVGQTRPVGVPRPVAHGTRRTESAGRGTPGRERRLEGPTRSTRGGTPSGKPPRSPRANARPSPNARDASRARDASPSAPCPGPTNGPPHRSRSDCPIRLCPCCGEPLQEHRVDFAAITDIPPQPRPIVQPYRVWVYRCPTCDTTVRAPHPDLAPDQFGATAHRMGPRVMAAAHATHYGLGVPVRKVPALLHLYTGVRLTQSAITQDASRRVSGPIGREYQALRDRSPRRTSSTPMTRAGGSGASGPI